MNGLFRPLAIAILWLGAVHSKTPEKDPTSIRGEVLEVGSYHLEGDLTGVPEPITDAVLARIPWSVKFSEKSDRIACEKGAQFGFRFRLTHLPRFPSIELKTVVKHPPFKNAEGKMETEYTIKTVLPVTDGSATGVTGNQLDREAKFIPGVWTFEHWFEDKKLISQSLTIFAPQGEGAHIRLTDVTKGAFFEDPPASSVYYFRWADGLVKYDISMHAILSASGVYSPEIPGLRRIDAQMIDGKLKILEPDAEAILALAKKHPKSAIFRAADDSLFYIRRTGETPVRKISIFSESGDEVILWRNVEKGQ